MDPEDLDERDQKLLNIPEVRETLKEIKTLPWKFIDNMQAGDLLEIKTAQNGCYRMQIIDPKDRTVLLVENSPEISRKAFARILGSKIINANNGMVLKIGAIAVGFSVIIGVADQTQGLILPLTEELYLNNERILPDFSNIVPGKK